MTLLVAVSRTHTRGNVLDAAVGLGETLGKELYIVHLLEGGNASDASQIREQLRAHVLEDDIVATVVVEQVDDTLSRPGPQLGRTLADVAADAGATHIVVGHTPKGLVDDIAQGSTAFAVADSVSVPVTIVPEGPTR